MSISNPNSHMNFEEDEVKQSLKRPAQEDYFPNIYIYIIYIYIYNYIYIIYIYIYSFIIVSHVYICTSTMYVMDGG